MKQRDFHSFSVAYVTRAQWVGSKAENNHCEALRAHLAISADPHMCSYKNCCFIAAKLPFAAARAHILQLQTRILQRQLYFCSCKNRDRFEVTKLAASKLPLAFLPPENMQQICGLVQRTSCCAIASSPTAFSQMQVFVDAI